MPQKNLQIKSLIVFTFSFIALLLSLSALFAILFTRGESVKYLIWNGDTVGIFPDFFESVSHSISMKPYDLGAIYPPFAYLIYLFWGLMIPNFDYYNWAASSVTPSATICAFFFFMLSTTAVLLYCKSVARLTRAQFCIFCFFVLSSAPYIYLIERGNTVILTIAFLCMFLYGYDSSNRIIQNLAFISLACAVAMKIYPVVFAVLVVEKLKLKQIILQFIYGVSFFFIPFAFFGGFDGLLKMLSNEFSLNAETGIDTRGFGFGYKINIDNTLSIINTLCGTNFNQSAILICLLIFILVVTCILSNEKWKKVLCLTLLTVLIPKFSWIYNGAYFIPVLALFLGEKSKQQPNFIDYFYLILLIGTFVPLPYTYLLTELPGVNKLSISTVVCSLSLIFLVILVVGDTFALLLCKKLRKNKNQKANLTMV